MAAQLPEDDSIGTLFSRLIEDIERFIRAQMRLYRAQVANRVRQGRSAIVMGLAALLLAHAAMITLLFGLVLTLRRYVGPGWATVIVVGAVLLAAAILAKLAVSRISKLTTISAPPEGAVK
jgi:small-conductance mechanosensitive channel